MPVDLSQAVAYVREYGGVIEGARLDRVMYSIPPAEAALTTLAAMQNSDGGFSYWLPHLTVSTVCDTAYVLGWLDDLDVREGPLVQRAIDFVFLHQRDDGGWDEVEGPASLDTPEFLVPGKVSTRVWLTAYCAHRLMRFGCADSPQCRACPVNFLLAHRDKTGRLHGYLRATWDALPVFHAFPDLSGHAFEQALAVTEPEFAPQSWEGSHLAWLGRALRDCDLPADHSLAARCLCALEDRQQRDGRWTSESGEQHAPDATVEVLRVLRDFGLA